MNHWTEIFIAQLREHGLEARAATAAGVSLRRVRALMEQDEGFAEEVEDAMEAAADVLEEEARRRAVEGVEKGVYYKGSRVDIQQEYSDTLLVQLLKGRRGRIFGEKREINLNAQGTVNVVVRSFARGQSGEVIEADAITSPHTPTGHQLTDPGRAAAPAVKRLAAAIPQKSLEAIVDEFA